jgi:hypothetical protein
MRLSNFEREGGAIALAYANPTFVIPNTNFLSQKQIKQSFSVFANYYMNSNTTIKFEYLNSTIKDGNGNLVSTPNYAKDELGNAIDGGEQRKLSARAEFIF